MSEEFESSLITIRDEDGTDYKFEQIDALETETGSYVALIPIYDDADETLGDDGELVILKITEEDGEEVLTTIDNDEEADKVADIFVERLSEFYEIEDVE